MVLSKIIFYLLPDGCGDMSLEHQRYQFLRLRAKIQFLEP